MEYLFYLFAAVSVISALLVVAARSPINSVIALIVCFLSFAGHYILLNAQFLAVVHIIVYTGAIMVLFLFVIMLLDLKEEERRRFNRFGVAAAVLSVVALGGITLVTLVSGAPDVAAPTLEGATRPLGFALFRDYVLPFEIVSLLLLVAMIGVVLLSRKDLK